MRKTCFKCGASKARSEFYKHPKMADGLLGKCKSCTRSASRAIDRSSTDTAWIR